MPNQPRTPPEVQLTAPTGTLTVLPLGGLGEIGMNNMLVGCDGQWVLLDAGVRFPGKYEPGVDVLLPDLSVIARLEGEFLGVVLTHGHEDHIGAVRFILDEFKVPVWGPAFALGLVRHRLREERMDHGDLRVVSPAQRFHVGPFEFQCLRVTHSIPDCHSLVLRCSGGTMVFTGDFKIDPGLPCGTRFDAQGFQALADEGVDLMLADSTNATRRGRTFSEQTVAEGLKEAISECPGRVFIGLFASNLYRLHAVFQAAKALDRKVCLLGRSLHKYLAVGAAHHPQLDLNGPVISVDQVNHHRDEELIFVCTGTQGEPRAALARIAAGQHRLSVREGDTLLMSARAIPGNLREIHRMIDGFSRQGASVLYNNTPWTIHASGHAAQEELKDLLRWVRPKVFVPVHGTRSFMEEHADLADECGIDDVVVIEDGELLRLDRTVVKRRADVHLEPSYLDGTRVGTRASLGIKRRMDMAYNGVVHVVVVLKGRDILAKVESEGCWTDGGQLSKTVERELVSYATGLRSLPADALKEEVRLFVRRRWRQETGKKPVVLSTLVRQGELV